jgi:predicted kinase
MEAIILIGLQACGKSTFCRERYFRTHIRINLDMLKTRHRERCLLETCVQTHQRFVVDNTNPRREDRQRYIVPAREAGFTVIGFHFQSRLAGAIERNRLRPETERIPEKGLRGSSAQLEIPTLDEGFDALYSVELRHQSGFTISE